MDLLAPVREVVAWIEAHPAIQAWLVGWLSGISAAQLAKHLAPTSLSIRGVERLTQSVAVAAGAATALAIWPRASGNRLAFALVVGMSAPLAYSWILAAIRWKWPAVAERATVAAVVERRTAQVQVKE